MALSELTVTLQPAATVNDLRAQWCDLHARSDAAFFLGWDWIGCWLRESGAAPLLLRAERDGRVMGLALLQPIRQHRPIARGIDVLLLHHCGAPDPDSITIEHNGILADRTCAVEIRAACLDALTRTEIRAPHTRAHWDELRLAGVAEPGLYAALAAPAGLLTRTEAFAPSWIVPLDALRAAGRPYIDSLSANTRHQLRRARRLYAERGEITAERAGSVPQALEWFDALKALHQRTWTGRGRPGSFAAPFFEQFHRALIIDCLPRGGVELVRIAAGGHPIGYVYNLIHDGWVCAYQTGLAYEQDARFKPGLVSHALCIERHIREGARRYDFLAGAARYKASLGVPGPDIASIVLQRPRLRLRLENAARAIRNRMRAAA